MPDYYTARVEAFFEAAHQLRSYKGKPEPLHGHSWKVEVEVEAPKVDSEGMSFDFVELNEAVRKLVKRLDYGFINDVAPFTDIAPTAENIAKWMYGELTPFAKAKGCLISSVRVFEGRHSSATYFERR
jgi:6-pyruvoyltetrahydropterin/6-carboxytetrahydropterin synthase